MGAGYISGLHFFNVIEAINKEKSVYIIINENIEILI